MNLAPLTNAFKDANGDINVAECVAFGGSVVGLGSFAHDCWMLGHTPDLVGLGALLGALVTSLGAAQGLRGDRQRLKDLDGR